ncbi:MAG: SDR family oxidoreductase [Pseudomonadota bacterium]
MRTLLSVIVLALMTLSTPAYADNHGDGQKAILITGASTGIGRYMAERLAKDGYYVYAGARKQKDIDELSAIDNIDGIRLDVTKQDEIDAAVETVAKGGRGLYGLVNNAGVFIGGPAVDVPVEELEWIMDVNVYGPYRVTKAFAPMIIDSKGRITTTGSISGILAGRFFSHYAMTKHAIEAYTDALAQEMAPFGVAVSVIEPGNYDSRIGDSAQKRMQSKIDDYRNAGSPFADAFDEFVNRDWDRAQYKAPDEVAAAAAEFFSAENPLRRYMVVPREEEAGWTINQIITETVQLNEGQAYKYSRDELVAMLDAALAADEETSD